MKRRDFLMASGAAAGVLPILSKVQAAACPPPGFTVNNSGMTSTICGNTSPGTAPAWFVNQADSTWTTIASVGTIGALPSSGGVAPSDSIISAWTGGAVDQSNREYILCANGGHADGNDNSAYALSLGAATPAWRRLSEPTPVAQMGDQTLESDGKFADGRPRAMHSTNECFGDGRVWFPMMCSVSSNQGGHANWVLSYDRTSLGAASSPLAYTTANLGPWTFHGRTNANTTAYGFGVGVFDRVNHRIYGFANGSGSAGALWWRFASQGSSIGVSTAYSDSLTIFPQWAICAHDLGIIVVGSSWQNDIKVLNIASNTWTTITNVSGTGFFAQGAGAVYIAANHSIAIGDPRTTGGSIYKLVIPTTSGGAYNSSGTWAWGLVTPSGGPSLATFASSSSNNSASSKFNIVEDMGNGQAAIVMVTKIAGPTYVYKIPAAGL